MDNYTPRPNTRQCKRCNRYLDTMWFTKDKNRADGLDRWCIVCKRDYYGSVWHPECIADGYQECCVCHEWYPETNEYFHKNKSQKNGLSTTCIECARNKSAKWYWDNEEYAKEKSREYSKEHSIEIVARVKKWVEDNPERAKETFRSIHRRKLADPIKRDYMNKSAKEWAQQNPIKAKAKTHRRRARLLNAEGSYTQADIDRLYAEQGGCCAYCGKAISWDVPRQIHIDHIMPLARGGSNWPDNLALACQPCNQSKNDKTLDEWFATRGW